MTKEEAMKVIKSGEKEVEVPKGADAMEKIEIRIKNQEANEEVFIEGWASETGFNKGQLRTMFRVAWERGHSGGWGEVFLEMEEVVDMVYEVIGKG